MNGTWWKQYSRWRARNFCGLGLVDGSGWLYRIEYHDGRYWRTVNPWHQRWFNQADAEAEIRGMGFEPEQYVEGESKPTVKWWKK